MLTSLAAFIRSVLQAIAVIVAFVILTFFAAGPCGWLSAQWDVRREHYKIKGGGLIRGSDIICNRLLKERYGIIASSGGGCLMLPHEIAFISGYNAVSVPAIRKHFGKDVLAECRGEAEEELRKKYGY